MSLSAFSTYGRLAKQLGSTTGKTFVLVPSGSALIPDLNDQFPSDEFGVPRVYTSFASGSNTILGNTASNRGDVILVMPGSYTISTVATLSNSGVRIIGVGPMGGVTFTGSAANILTITGDNCEIANIRFVAASAFDAVNMTGADYCWVHDCMFEGVGGSTSRCIEMLTTACNDNLIERCKFFSNLNTSSGTATQTAHITGLGSRNIIQDCTFQSHRTSTSNAGATTDCIVFSNAADIGNVLRRNTVYESNGATFTEGFDYGTSALDFLVHSNNFLLATAGNAIVNGGNSAGFDNNVGNGTV